MMIIHPFPPRLPTNPYLDALYTPMQAAGLSIDTGKLRASLVHALWGGQGRIIHLHFFDELTQRPGKLQTALRSLAFLALLMLLQWRGVRLVWTVHNLLPHELYHPHWAFVVGKLVARWSKAIIVHSEAAKVAFERRYGLLPQVRVVPIGSYAGLYGPVQERATARARLGLPAHRRITLAFGALRPYKYTEGLIAAFARLPAAERGLLLIAGTGRDTAYTALVAERASATPGVIFHQRYIPDDELAAYLAAADLVAMPYRRMLTSAVLLCALAYARPVLAPAFGPVAELVQDGENGFLYAPGDDLALAAALERALAHPDLDALGQAGAATAAAFPWETIAAATQAIYTQVEKESRHAAT